MEDEKFYNFVFENFSGENIVIPVEGKTTVQELIHLYFKRKGKENLIVNNLEEVYFIYNSQFLNYENNNQKVSDCFREGNSKISVFHLEYNKNLKDIKIIETIKDNVYTCVEKANYGGRIVAIKKIKKEQIKDDLKDSLCLDEITDEYFKEEIVKFNMELQNMIKCSCQNSVEIYDYFDTEKNFVIIMELCDNTLLRELAKTKSGFTPEKIREILLELNNVFKLMKHYKIVHRDIKLNNILVKYLDKDQTKFKVLLSDYGVSNQLSSMTGRLRTHAGTQIIMAPEILNGEEYNDKCDLWSLGVNIYQLYTKKPPYSGKFDKVILQQIDKLGQSVLDVVKDDKLKDLLSKLLVKDPKDRISWEEYFEHEFFK